MINETIVLFLCFVITFGFIGYKLAEIIKTKLDNYSRKIADELNYSEKLKFEAVKLLDDAKKQKSFLDDNLIQMQDDAKKKMQEIKDIFNSRLKEITEKYTSDNNKKIELATNRKLIFFEMQTKSIIEKIVMKYVSNISNDDMQNAITHAMSNINFKILSSKKTKL